MSPQFINFIHETHFFYENFFSNQNCLLYSNYDYFLFLTDFSQYNFLQILSNSSLYTKSLITFINQTEDINLFNNLENITAIYHYSIPNTKLAYPEPFIASPSFMHTDLWFIHILVYQYWLWFVFVFIIVFFFITFICTIRWCNMRVRPRRETRGVSRSKCGDLVTACVPVTWATSIIVNESTDAIDYYDGFGTTELVVGIRAYQWGWEYYYPKDIDLNYNIKPNYSAFVGNSLKYTKASDVTLSANNLWKFYQNKTSDRIVTPAHLLVLPVDNYKLLNFLNFNDIGASTTQEVNAFKRVRMFSKTFTSNLVFSSNPYSNKYKNFSYLYLNDGLFTDSYLYGLKRQHNFNSMQSLLNDNATFLNTSSVSKIINYNFKNSFILPDTLSNLKNFNTFNKVNNLNLNDFAIYLNFFTSNLFTNSTNKFLTSFLLRNSFITSINDNSDKKQILNPLLKLFNSKIKKNNFFNDKNLNNLADLSDNSTVLNNSYSTNFFFNSNKTYKIATVFSSNQAVTLTNRYIRNFVKTSPYLANYNYSLDLNTVNNYLKIFNSEYGMTNDLITNLSKLNWLNLNTVSKLSSVKTNFDYPYSPVSSNHPLIDAINYDTLKNTLVEGIPAVLQGKEELMPNFLTSIYWNFYWNNSTIDWRFFNGQTYHNLHRLFYFPMFNFYYDYDFRNWQAMELLEDSFWESVYSIYNHDEYLNLANDFYEYEFFNRFNNLYNNFDRVIKFRDKILNKPFFKNTNSLGDFYSNGVYVDDAITTAPLLPTKDFFMFPLFNTASFLDDSYESSKFLSHLCNTNNKLFLNFFSTKLQPHSYSFVFDMFRADYDDFSWFTDDSMHLPFKAMAHSFLNLMQKTYTENTQFKSSINSTFNTFLPVFNNLSNDTIIFSNPYSPFKSTRFSNNLNLRSPVKNSIVTYSAIQKVFRTRFDENRSNTKLTDFGYFYSKQPFISSPRIQYEKILGKTKEAFLKINFYKNNFQPFINNFYELNSGLNFYFFDFPFLLAMKSDASRYLWFDWFAKWGFYEVQPSSSSRYAIHGMPYFSKNFEFSTLGSESLNESETYLIRIARARRNYLPNWTYTPYFYAKNNAWYQNNLMYEIINSTSNSLSTTQYLLYAMNWYWEKFYFLNWNTYQFFPSNSGTNSYTKLGWKPQNSIQSYYYSISTLIDILTKREYLYRELLVTSNKLTNLPFYLTNSPSNPLIDDIKSSFLFIDPIIANNEYSRDVYFNSLNFFNFTVLKSFLTSCNDFINLSIVTDYLFYYFFNTNLISNLQHNTELYKNQYRPLRKGVTNMIRLHATGAIAMPIEIRLQILASSKDVIHSWAIPSAGIKIDCIPGYSSHKVIIFLVSGIFWGQCMEICGRYHHWMPIVVYFMKRDLFFLWCTHFVFLTGANNMWNINDRQFTDYIRLVSFDKYSWLSEINN